MYQVHPPQAACRHFRHKIPHEEKGAAIDAILNTGLTGPDRVWHRIPRRTGIRTDVIAERPDLCPPIKTVSFVIRNRHL